MATIGQALTAPEVGWKRYDDADGVVKYGAGFGKSTDTAYYKNTITFKNSSVDINEIKFNFKGTKFRIIAFVNPLYDADITILVDGEAYTSKLYYDSTSVKQQILVYEKLNLFDGIHEVIISGTKVVLDAIDIDSTGRLLHPDEVTDPKDLAVGKRIRCNYKSATTGTVGTFSGLGQETKDFIPVASSATPDGDFYYIMVEDSNGIKKLIADRNIQSSISWDVLNTAGIASGSGLPSVIRNNKTIGGNAFGTEFDDVGTGSIYNGVYVKAFDGDINSIFSNRVNLSSKEVVAGYKFSTPTVINYVQVKPRDLYAQFFYKNFKIQASNNTTNGISDGEWITLASNLKGDGTDSWQKYSFSNSKEYKFYRLIGTGDTNNKSVISGVDYYYIQLSEIVMDNTLDTTTLAFTTRLLTGGTTTADKDNEWDKYIVNSTLGGAITAGDNNVWNWSGLYSWTSTSGSIATSSSTYRVVRGFYSSDTYFNTLTTGVQLFRPVLLIENLFVQLNKSFILLDGKYKKFVGKIPAKYNVATTSSIPVMTSNTTPNAVASASGEYSGGYFAWRAFDGIVDNNGWVSANNTYPQWLAYEFDNPIKIGGYSMVNRPATLNAMPKAWNFEGWNGATWVVLDTRTETAWENGTYKEFLFNNYITYKKYRVNITSNNGNTEYVAIGELKMFETLSYIPETPPSWQTVSATLPSLDTFKGEGIDDLSVFDRKATVLTQLMTSEVLGAGKLMKSKVDINKYFDINSLNVK